MTIRPEIGGKAEIAGGGVAGLVSAIALAQRGWAVTIHERAPVMRFHGSGIGVGDTAQRALGLIGVLDEVLAGQMPLNRREMRAADGDLIGYIDWPKYVYFIPRSLLLERLLRIANALGVVIKTDSEVVKATPDGKMELADGQLLTADLVVVANGAKSHLRNFVVKGSLQETLTYGAARTITPRLPGDVDIPSNAWAEYWSGKRRLYFGPIANGEVYLSFRCDRRDASRSSGSREGDLIDIDIASWKRSFPRLAGVLDRMPEPPKWAPFNQVSASSWVNGRMVMIGDAAHAMTPALGAGAGTAMMDAVTMVRAATSGPDLPAALKVWETEYRPSIDRFQRSSRFWSGVNNWPVILQKAFVKATPHVRLLRESRIETVPKSVVAITRGGLDNQGKQAA